MRALGAIVKSNNKMYWGHKASVLGYPRQGIPLDAVAVADAATFDGKTLYPHMERLLEELPEIEETTETVLYDSACDDSNLKALFADSLGLGLKTSTESQAQMKKSPKGCRVELRR